MWWKTKDKTGRKTVVEDKNFFYIFSTRFPLSVKAEIYLFFMNYRRKDTHKQGKVLFNED